MKRISRWFKNIFSPKELQGLDVQEILAAFNEESIRKLWIYEVFSELKRLNLEVDRLLILNRMANINDLAVRRKTFQDVLEGILAAKRQIKTHNPKSKGEFDLDSVTGGSAYI